MGCFVLAVPFWFAVTRFTSDTNPFDDINQEFAEQPAATITSPAYFAILDGTQFTESTYPWIGYPVKIITEDQLLGPGDNLNTAPREFKIKYAVQTLSKRHKRVIFQIDSWVISAGDSEKDARKHVKWYLDILKWAREADPEGNYGFYNLPYSPAYALQKDKKRMHEYQRILQRLAPIMLASDSLYPVFLAKNQDTDHRYFSMMTQLYISKSFAKPVFPVVSHQYSMHDGSSTLQSVAAIQQQCAFLKKYADGMVWWSDKGEQWKEGWYHAVKPHCFD